MNSKFIQGQIYAIQTKRNFNPKIGTTQVKGFSPQIQRDFGRFQLLLEMVKKFELDVSVPYGGENVVGEGVTEKKPFLLYIHQEGTSDVWKFGKSQNPSLRKKSLATGNSEPLFVRHALKPNDHNPDMEAVERVLKCALRKIKTRDKGNPNKCEWFRANKKFVRGLVSLIKTTPVDHSNIKALVDELA